MSLKLGNNSGRNFSPGPANYNPSYKQIFTETSYTMRKRPQTSKTDNYPGVGNYVLRTDKSLKVPTYK